MRGVPVLTLLVFLLSAINAWGQNADWKSLGRPLPDDTKRMEDRYVYFNDNATDKNVSLDRPVLVASDIQEWLQTHIPEVLTLDGPRYEQQIAVNRRYFTPNGYADYIASLTSARIPTLLKEQRYKMAAVVTDPPNLFAKGTRKLNATAAVYVWQAEIPLQLNYLGLTGSNTYKIYLTVELVRIPMQTDNNLVALNGWRFSGRPRSPLFP
jgi:hypothetical protein